MSPATDMSDAKTFVAWLDAQPQVNKNRKVGVQGYCMGGPMSFHTASAVPDRIGAVASFHGGGLVNDASGPNSPHLLAAATKASFLIAIAENDDKQRPNDKTVSEGDVRQGQAGRRRSRSIRPPMAGARRIRRSTTSQRRSGHGPACWLCMGRRSPKQMPLRRRFRSPSQPSSYVRLALRQRQAIPPRRP